MYKKHIFSPIKPLLIMTNTRLSLGIQLTPLVAYQIVTNQYKPLINFQDTLKAWSYFAKCNFHITLKGDYMNQLWKYIDEGLMDEQYNLKQGKRL